MSIHFSQASKAQLKEQKAAKYGLLSSILFYYTSRLITIEMLALIRFANAFWPLIIAGICIAHILIVFIIKLSLEVCMERKVTKTGKTLGKELGRKLGT